MEPGPRIKLIQGVRDKLQSSSFDDEALVLEEFGIGVREPYNLDGDMFTITEWLRQADENRVIALARHLGVSEDNGNTQNAEEDVSALPDNEPAPLFIFASHLAREREFVGDVAKVLGQYGVELFVAHDSIQMDADWQPEIAGALSRCHAGVAFVHKGFKESAYCQQEVGWLLGRQVPMARYISGESPAALLSQKQGKPIHGLDAVEVAAEILEYVRRKPELHGSFTSSLSHALLDSPNFRATNHIWAVLPDDWPLTPKQAETLVLAAETQDQVYWAGYRERIANRLAEEPGAAHLSERLTTLRRNAGGTAAIRDRDNDND